MKKISKLILSFIIFIFGLQFASWQKIIPIETAVFEKSKYEIEIGKELQIKYLPNPLDATIKSATWTSSNTEIAEVNKSGLVTAKKIGETIISVLINEEVSATCFVEVIYSPIENLDLSINELFTTLDEQTPIEYTYGPNTINESLLKWDNTNPSVAIIEDNKIKPIKGGLVHLSIYYDENKNNKKDEDEMSSTCKVCVSDENISYNQIDIHETFDKKIDSYMTNFSTEPGINYLELSQIIEFFFLLYPYCL